MAEVSKKDRMLLRAAIRRTAAACSEASREQSNLDLLCESIWGFAPGDRDVDGILDSVYGLAGEANPIKIDEFIGHMDDAE